MSNHTNEHKDAMDILREVCANLRDMSYAADELGLDRQAELLGRIADNADKARAGFMSAYADLHAEAASGSQDASRNMLMAALATAEVLDK